MASSLKSKSKVKLDLLTSTDIINDRKRYQRWNVMKSFNKNKEPSYIKYLDVGSLYGWAMSQKLPVNDFRWFENASIEWRFYKNL